MKRLWFAVIMASTAALMTCSWMPGPMDPKCDAKQIREFSSPDRTRKAVEYHTLCEDGTYHSTVEVADAAGTDRATAMHASIHERAASPVWPDLKVEWKSAKELWVWYPAGVDAQCISSPTGVTVHCLDASIAR